MSSSGIAGTPLLQFFILVLVLYLFGKLLLAFLFYYNFLFNRRNGMWSCDDSDINERANKHREL